MKSEIESALTDAKAAVESGDPDQMTEKTNALSQAAMKLGEAMYKAQQAEGGGDAGAAEGATEGATGDEAPGEEDVVDAEFSEVDDETKH